MGKDIGGGSFSCRSLSDVNGAGGNMGAHKTTQEAYGTQSKLLGDSERAAHVGRGNGKMRAQANPDHGSHGIRSLASANG